MGERLKVEMQIRIRIDRWARLDDEAPTIVELDSARAADARLIEQRAANTALQMAKAEIIHHPGDASRIGRAEDNLFDQRRIVADMGRYRPGGIPQRLHPSAFL